MHTAVVFIVLTIFTTHGLAWQVKYLGEVWQLSGLTYTLNLSTKDGSIVSLMRTGKKGSILSSGEDGLWRVRFRDGLELNARSATMQAKQIAPKNLLLTYHHPDVSVNIKITAHDDGVDFDAELEAKSKAILDFVLPAKLRFEPKNAHRL
ncbi:MAG: hypothetical protein NZ781_12745, partial [Armatimonadetes bacterium]|nr:hypothetical protein [Armatimonadota bacterium]